MTTAWYSERQRREMGVLVWKSPEGRDVYCTSVGDEAPLFDDSVDLGPVDRYVRRAASPDRNVKPLCEFWSTT